MIIVDRKNSKHCPRRANGFFPPDATPLARPHCPCRGKKLRVLEGPFYENLHWLTDSEAHPAPPLGTLQAPTRRIIMANDALVRRSWRKGRLFLLTVASAVLLEVSMSGGARGTSVFRPPIGGIANPIAGGQRSAGDGVRDGGLQSASRNGVRRLQGGRCAIGGAVRRAGAAREQAAAAGLPDPEVLRRAAPRTVRSSTVARCTWSAAARLPPLARSALTAARASTSAAGACWNRLNRPWT